MVTKAETEHNIRLSSAELATLWNTYMGDTARSDVHDFMKECLVSSTELEDQARKVMLSKGGYIRPPYISIPEKVDFVQKQNFLTGWFGDRRPLTAIEITQLYNIQTNALGKALIIGFSQVAKSDTVSEYFIRGRDIASKHIEILVPY